MKICCLGDSLTEGDYGVFGKSGIANVHDENYPLFLSEYLGVETVNKGKCGYTSTSYLKYYMDGNVDVSSADIIVIMLGTNGGLDLDEVTQADKDFYTLIDLCRKDAPQAKLVLCTPPHVTENPEMSNCGYAVRVHKAVEFVKSMAVELSLDLIDMMEIEEFSAENECVMQPNDGIHFSETGYKVMARFIGDRLKELYPAMF